MYLCAEYTMKLALWQTPPIHELPTALEALDQQARDAAAKGAHVLVTPELFLGGYNIGPERIEALARQADELIGKVSAIAASHNIAIVCGLADTGKSRPCNTAIAISDKGVELARYQKTHLFGDVDAAQFEQGAHLPEVFTLNGWRVGLAICYDIEFPELARHLATQGAELILIPTANMAEFSTISNRVVPCRAEENGLFVAYANYIGAEAPFTYGGSSCVCGPDGEDVVRADARESTLLIAELDRGAVQRVRNAQHYLDDRRADLYGMPGEATSS